MRKKPCWPLRPVKKLLSFYALKKIPLILSACLIRHNPSTRVSQRADTTRKRGVQSEERPAFSRIDAADHGSHGLPNAGRSYAKAPFFFPLTSVGGLPVLSRVSMNAQCAARNAQRGNHRVGHPSRAWRALEQFRTAAEDNPSPITRKKGCKNKARTHRACPAGALKQNCRIPSPLQNPRGCRTNALGSQQ